MIGESSAGDLPNAEAISIARSDAASVYGDLSRFRVRISLEADGWHVVYEIKNPHTKGGGPSYVIDATTDEIVSKRYYQ